MFTLPTMMPVLLKATAGTVAGAAAVAAVADGDGDGDSDGATGAGRGPSAGTAAAADGSLSAAKSEPSTCSESLMTTGVSASGLSGMVVTNSNSSKSSLK